LGIAPGADGESLGPVKLPIGQSRIVGLLDQRLCKGVVAPVEFRQRLFQRGNKSPVLLHSTKQPLGLCGPLIPEHNFGSEPFDRYRVSLLFEKLVNLFPGHFPKLDVVF
jgi:hypothetical protein